MAETCGFHNEYSKMIIEADQRSKSNSHRLDNFEKMIELMHDMNLNIQSIAIESKGQGDEIRALIKMIEKHDIKFDKLEEEKEAKGSVARLHDRVDATDGKLDDFILKQSEEGASNWKNMKWFMVTTGIGAIVTIVLAIVMGS